MFSTQLRHTLVLSIALGSTFASFAHAKCCTSEVQTVWVHGRYSNAAPGDVVVNYVDGSSVIAPIIDAIGENYDHSMIVTDSASRVTHNLGDPATVETGWTCSHPLDPYQMRPMAPGAQSSVYPDDAGTFKAGAVLHGAGTPGCNVPGLAQGGVGYDLYGYSHSVRNGMCVQLLTDSCGVAQPTPRYYDAITVGAAVSAVYNDVYSQAVANRPWILAATGLCPGGSRYAANQVVNTFLYGNPWDTQFEPWNVPVSDVVTPAQLVATYAGAKEGVGLVPGYYTTRLVRVCYNTQCP